MDMTHNGGPTSSQVSIRRRRMYPTTPIRELRHRRALRLNDVARAAGISATRLSQIECGLVTPTEAELRSVRSAIESLSPDPVLGGDAA